MKTIRVVLLIGMAVQPALYAAVEYRPWGKILSGSWGTDDATPTVLTIQSGGVPIDIYMDDLCDKVDEAKSAGDSSEPEIIYNYSMVETGTALTGFGRYRTVHASRRSLSASYSLDMRAYGLSAGYVAIKAEWDYACDGEDRVITKMLTPGSLNEGSLIDLAPAFPDTENCLGSSICYLSRRPFLTYWYQTNANWSVENILQEVGDPINVVKGNVTHQITDWTMPGGLDFQRYYNSLREQALSPLGPQWTHSYNIHIEPRDTETLGSTQRWMYFFNGFGEEVAFRYNEQQDTYEPPYSMNLMLTTNADGTAQIFEPPASFYQFAAGGTIARLTNQAGRGLYFSYEDGNLSSVSNGFSEQIQFSYNASHLLSRVTSVDTNLSIQFTYTPEGELGGSDLETGDCRYIRTYQYGDRGSNRFHSLTQYVNAASRTSVWSYAADGDGHLTGIGIGGHVSGGIIFRSDVSKEAYVPVSTVEYERGTNAYRYTYEYHPVTHEVEAILSPRSSEDFREGIFFEHDDFGNQISVTRQGDPASMTGQYLKVSAQYDSAHNPTNIQFGYNRSPLNSPYTWRFDYDPNTSQLRNSYNPESERTEFTYTNSLLQEVRRYFSETNFVRIYSTYGERGLLQSVTNENGAGLSYGYDAVGRVTRVTPSAGPELRFELREDGYATNQILPGLSGERTTAFEVDRLGRITQVTYPDRLTEAFSYDAYHNITSSVDRAGRPHTASYYLGMKPSAFTDWLVSDGTSQPVVISCDYDQQMNAVEITDPLGRCVESYLLDELDRPVEIFNVEGQKMSIVYGLEDWIQHMTRFDTSEVGYEYNQQGLLASREYSDGRQSFTYALDGMLITASNHLGVVSNIYDSLNYLVSQKGLGPAGTVAYAHYPAGQVSNRTCVAGQTFYTLDAGDRLVSITTGEDVFDVHYDPYNGRLGGIDYPGGLKMHTAYDVMDRPAMIRYESVSLGVTSYIVRIDYHYDAVGMVTQRTENGSSTVYTYDTLDRLISESGPVGSMAYSYDLAGNRLTKTRDGIAVGFQLGAGNRMTGWTASVDNFSHAVNIVGHSSEPISFHKLYGVHEIEGRPVESLGTNFWLNGFLLTNTAQDLVARISDEAGNIGTRTLAFSVVTNAAYAYDAAGNTTRIDYNGAEHRTLSWDPRYRITAVSTGGTALASYEYDALGRRVKITEGTNLIHLVYDGDHVIAETDDSGVLVRSYIHGPGVDNLLAMKVAEGGETNTYFYIKDHLNSTLALVDESGTTVESYTYDAWGRVQVTDGSGTPLRASKIGNRYTFQGRSYSWTTGLYYFRARYYDPITGRWLSKDPIGISGGLNQYNFVGNNPVNRVDPYGLAWYDNWHYEDRDARNSNLPTTENDVRGDESWTALPDSMNIFHDNGDDFPETKYIHPDGREAVYDGKTGRLITDANLKGTFNYVNPMAPSWNPLKWPGMAGKGLGHYVADVLPYQLWGNERRNTGKICLE